MNSIPDPKADAALAILAAIGFDMFPGPGSGSLTPPADSRLAAMGYTLRGWLIGQDALLAPGTAMAVDANPAYYGYLAQSAANPALWAVIVRGTADMLEWIEDAKFALVDHPGGGKVEAGFYGIYETLRYHPVAGSDGPAAAGIAQAVGQGSITVIGHSLGAAVATYLALALAKDCALGSRVRARLFASPRPGDEAFAWEFMTHVSDGIAYAYELDLVPRVPFGDGYTPLHCLKTITPDLAQARIQFNPSCFHHVFCYAACLDFSLMNWEAVPNPDKVLTACIKGPNG